MRLIRWMTPLVLVGLLSSVRADDEKLDAKDLPKAVRKAVKKEYPKAKIIAASKEKDEEGETVYEVETKVGGKSVDFIIDEEGEIKATEKEIEVEDLPKAVIKAAKAKFSKAKIIKVEEVTDEDDKVVYEVAFETEGKKPFEVIMSPGGKILESEDEEEDDDKEMTKKKDKDDDEEDDDKKVSKKKDMDDDEDEDDDKKVSKKKDKDDDDKKVSKKKDMDDDEDEDDDKKVSKKKDKDDDDEGDDDKKVSKKKDKDDDEKDKKKKDKDDDDEKKEKKPKS